MSEDKGRSLARLRQKAEERFDGKVSPEALQIMYLDEIAQKLGDVEERLHEIGDSVESQRREMTKSAEGITDTYTIAVTDSDTLLPFTLPVLSVTIINDGAGNVFAAINKSSYGDAPMFPTEVVTINVLAPRINLLRLKTTVPGAAASVRVVAIR